MSSMRTPLGSRARSCAAAMLRGASRLTSFTGAKDELLGTNLPLARGAMDERVDNGLALALRTHSRAAYNVYRDLAPEFRSA